MGNDNGHGWLYVIAVLAMIHSCNSSKTADKIEKRIKSLDTSIIDQRVLGVRSEMLEKLSLMQSDITSLKPTIVSTNGNAFYNLNGNRAYFTINGKPASSYITNSTILENQ
ncbi:MAG: hypothetical protein AABX66_02030 [Nanoarchaeota archaeon]